VLDTKRIAEAGLQAHTASALKVALQQLVEGGTQASLVAWNGTQCDLLVADIDDGYGARAAAVCARRRGKVLAFSRASGSIGLAAMTLSPDAAADMLIRALHALLDRSAQSDRAPVAAAAYTGISLLELCRADSGDKPNLIARSGSYTVLIRRNASRILAATHRDLLGAKSRLLDATWSIAGTGEFSPELAAFDMSFSLDTFLIGACIGVENKLPQLTAARYRLSTWPDIGRLSDYPGILPLCAKMVRGACSAKELSLQTGASIVRINALLWAARAAGILQAEQLSPVALTESVAVPNRSLFAKALVKLKQRFGLNYERIDPLRGPIHALPR
jgi:hypothetical protein